MKQTFIQKKKMSLVLFLLGHLVITSISLQFCRPQFQEYAALQQYTSIQNDELCWYDPQSSGSDWILRSIFYKKYRIKGAVLAHDVDHTILCQKMDFSILFWGINQIESGVLNFNTYNDQERQIRFRMLRNGQHFYDSSSNSSSIQHNIEITISSSQIQICIQTDGESGQFIVDNFTLLITGGESGSTVNNPDATINHNNTSITNNNDTSPIDAPNSNGTSRFSNVEVLVITFQINLRQNQDELLLISDKPIGEFIGLREFVKKNIRVSYGKQRIDNIQLLETEGQALIVRLTPNQSLMLENLSIEIPNVFKMSSEYYRIKVQLKQSFHQVFYSMSEEEGFYQNIHPIAIKITSIIGTFRSYSQNIFCSYFILNLLTFCNLSILYNFLNIPMIPNFSKSTLEDVATFYIQQTSITTWLIDTFNLPENTFRFKVMQYEREFIEKQKYRYKWFGAMGMTSSVIENMLQIGIIMGFLIVKILLIRLVMKKISRAFFILSGIQINYKVIIMTEFIPMIPFLCIVTAEGIPESNFNFYDKIQKAFHLLLLYLCLLGLPIWYIMKRNAFYDEKKRRNQKNKLKNNDPEVFYSLFQNFMNLSIPLSLVFGDPIFFLTINTIVLIIRFTFFCNLYKRFNGMNKIFGTLMNIVWLIHHASFLTIYVIGQNLANFDDKVGALEKCKFCGFITICTIMVGGLIELTRSLIDLIIFLANLVKIGKYVHSLKKLQVQAQQNQGNLIKPCSFRLKNNEKDISEKPKQFAVKDMEDEIAIPTIFENRPKKIRSRNTKQPPIKQQIPNKKMVQLCCQEQNQAPQFINKIKDKLSIRRNKIKPSRNQS